MANRQLTVIDFFSGAGGFSEGFRQQGFSIVQGIDCWQPAVDTHNLNHGLGDRPQNILDYEGEDSGDVSKIKTLPNTDIIIGSPSCISFSMSNKCGKADKTDGIRLIEAFLRIVTVKKHQPGSILKAWLMENVPNSQHYVKERYTFADLRLGKWANQFNISPQSTALKLNPTVLNSGDFGAPQNRKRLICGESIKTGCLPVPVKLSSHPKTLGEILSDMPKPSLRQPKGYSTDPNYKHLCMKVRDLTDHFYDTGLHAIEWEQAKYLKTMHPYMGKMSFPENKQKPSRTVTATRSASSREALIYKSEYNRQGHGEYRLPTVRETATLMGYPYTYQFTGTEFTKWKLVGNSVSPQLSASLAKAILSEINYSTVADDEVEFPSPCQKPVNNLNTFTEASFSKSKQRKTNARLRRSVYKGENMTIDLLNYAPDGIADNGGINWGVCIFYGTGTGYGFDYLNSNVLQTVNKILHDNNINPERIAQSLDNLLPLNLNPSTLQKVYEEDAHIQDGNNPLVLIQKIENLIKRQTLNNKPQRIHVAGLTKPDYSLTQLVYIFMYTYLVHECLQLGQRSHSKQRPVFSEQTVPVAI